MPYRSKPLWCQTAVRKPHTGDSQREGGGGAIGSAQPPQAAQGGKVVIADRPTVERITAAGGRNGFGRLGVGPGNESDCQSVHMSTMGSRSRMVPVSPRGC
jgi:hypothetical protein